MRLHPRAPGGAPIAVLVGALTFGLTTPAAAQQECDPRDGLSTCVASDNLWTHPGGGRWFSLSPTEALDAGATSFAFTPVFIHKPIGLSVSSADPEGTTIYAVENVVATTFLLGVGITDRLQATMAAPVVLYQTGASKADIVGSDEALSRSAMGDLRFGLRYALLPRSPEDRDDGFGLAARFEIVAPSGQNDAFAGYGSATYAFGAAGNYRIGDFTLGLDLGARLRREMQLATASIGHQISASAGAGYDVIDDGWLSVNLETWALFGLAEQRRLADEAGGTGTREVSGPPHIPLEWMLSVRTAGLLDGRFRASLGGGSFIPTASDVAVTTPAFRTALSLAYVFEETGEDADAE